MCETRKRSNYISQIVRGCGLLVAVVIVPYHMQKMNHLIQKWLFRDQHMQLSPGLQKRAEHLKDGKEIS